MMSGIGSTKNGELHFKGQMSRVCLQSETHFMQKTLRHPPLQITGFTHTSLQMTHSYFSLISCDFKKQMGVSGFFFSMLYRNNYKAAWSLLGFSASKTTKGTLAPCFHLPFMNNFFFSLRTGS
jgi:hypothetical protein